MLSLVEATRYIVDKITRVTGVYFGENIHGQGGFFVVYKGVLLDGKVVAM